MIKESHANPQYIDGVIELHAQLYNAYLRAMEIASKYLDIPTPKKEEHRIHFSIFINFSENVSSDKITGYFMYKNTILRFLPISFEQALLFPVTCHNYWEGMTDTPKMGKGISYIELKNLRDEQNLIRLSFISFSNDLTPALFNITMRPIRTSFSDKLIIDEIGKPFHDFQDISTLSVDDLPLTFQTRKFTLVGKQHYAQFTTDKDIDCVLYAQNNNEYDVNAIKVLRWFPKPKEVQIEQLIGNKLEGGDHFFELGYISREENAELHKYMMEYSSRILFGKIQNDKISILGGVGIFKTNNLKFPRSLFNINLI